MVTKIFQYLLGKIFTYGGWYICINLELLWADWFWRTFTLRVWLDSRNECFAGYLLWCWKLVDTLLSCVEFWKSLFLLVLWLYRSIFYASYEACETRRKYAGMENSFWRVVQHFCLDYNNFEPVLPAFCVGLCFSINKRFMKLAGCLNISRLWKFWISSDDCLFFARRAAGWRALRAKTIIFSDWQPAPVSVLFSPRAHSFYFEFVHTQVGSVCLVPWKMFTSSEHVTVPSKANKTFGSHLLYKDL